MKQILLLMLFISINLNTLKAQGLSITPNNVTLDTILDFANDPFPEFLFGSIYSKINNDSSEAVQLRWDISQIVGPSEWKTRLCVNNQSGSCYTWGITSNLHPATSLLPLLIEANDNSLFDLYVRPNLTPGCGTYEIRVSSFDDSTNVQVVGVYHYRFNVDADCNPIVANDNFDKATAKIYPNPTTDYFTITDNPYVKSIEVFNIVGKQMGVTPFQNGDAINVAGFPNGLYLVRMLDDDGYVLKTTRLIKR